MIDDISYAYWEWKTSRAGLAEGHVVCPFCDERVTLEDHGDEAAQEALIDHILYAKDGRELWTVDDSDGRGEGEYVRMEARFHAGETFVIMRGDLRDGDYLCTKEGLKAKIGDLNRKLVAVNNDIKRISELFD